MKPDIEIPEWIKILKEIEERETELSVR